MPDSLTMVLSGPLAQKGPLQLAMHQAGAKLDTPAKDPRHGLPDEGPTVSWVRVLTDDLNGTVAAASRAGWVLRSHWNTPKCRACNGQGADAVGAKCGHCAGVGVTNHPLPDPAEALTARLADMTARLARLEAKGA